LKAKYIKAFARDRHKNLKTLSGIETSRYRPLTGLLSWHKNLKTLSGIQTIAYRVNALARADTKTSKPYQGLKQRCFWGFQNTRKMA
jgi:hypothetical protein